jgi:hypothetical protein
MGFADDIRAEQAAVQAGTAVACGYIAGPDYDNLACIRAQHDEGASHVADVNGDLVQWMAPTDVG